MGLRRCEKCKGPGPALYTPDSGGRYVCRSCHPNPEDPFFDRPLPKLPPPHRKLMAVYKAAQALVNIPPYPWNRRKRRRALLELASKVNDIDYPLGGPNGQRSVFTTIEKVEKVLDPPKHRG